MRHPTNTRLVQVLLDEESQAVSLRFSGPAMLRGIATAVPETDWGPL
ncbi:hypothetical protein ACFWVC_18390 [Streptomyces sp. NPDC058691]